MKTLTFTKANNLSQLMDELLAAIPALAPVTQNAQLVPVMQLEGQGDSIRLTVPDTADETAIGNVVTAHVAQAPPPPPNLQALFNTYSSNVQAATTVVQLKSALTNDLAALLKAIAKGNRGNVS